MTSSPCLVACLLAGFLHVACADEPLVHFEADPGTMENGKTLDMAFTEVERRPDASIVQVTFRSGGSVPSSLFVLRGMCLIARSRGESYFVSTRLPAPPGRYIVNFQKAVPTASEAVPRGPVFSVSQCGLLGY